MNNILKKWTKRFLLCILVAVCMITAAFAALQIYGYLSDRFPAIPLNCTVNAVSVEPLSAFASASDYTYTLDYAIPLQDRMSVHKHPSQYFVIAIDCSLVNSSDKTVHSWRCKDISNIDNHTFYLNKNTYEFASATILPGESTETRFMAITRMDNQTEEGIQNIYSSAELIVTAVEYKADKGVIVDYGHSLKYSETDIDEAILAVRKDFANMKGCKLYSLSYAGDETGKKELETYNRDLPEEERVKDCIVFHSVFRSPLLGGGAWEAHAIYTWNWIVVRDENGQWKVVNKGYA